MKNLWNAAGTAKKAGILAGGIGALAAIVLAVVFLNQPEKPIEMALMDTTGQRRASNALIDSGANPNVPEGEEETYPDAVAWLTYTGTDIDNPVMQSKDNDYYLRRNEEGATDVWGCYFLDYECGPDSKNTIIYGHSLGDSSDAERFSQLKQLNQDDFAEEYDTIQLLIDGETRSYQVFSSGLASDLTDHEAINANPDTAAMQTIIDMAMARSQRDYGVEVSSEDSILTLATCTSDENTRYLVVAKRVEREG